MTLPIIAIDGPAASGKGTIARKIAAALEFAYLDTGLLYRAIGIETAKNPADPAAAIAAATALPAQIAADPDFLQNPLFRTDEASSAASRVAATPEIRSILLEFQRNFAKTPPGGQNGAVLDGRDIGTVICPEAPAKLFITAALETRTMRRLKELQNRGITTTYEAVLRDMRERDTRDAERKTAPMKPADDALELDTTHLTPDQAFQKAMDYIRSRLGH